MPLIALLLAIQAVQDPPEDLDPPRKRSDFEIGPIFQYWFPRFKGKMRVDGTTRGTTLNFTDDLNLPDETAILMYGGGSIGGRIHSANEWMNLAGVAEYWTHSWTGREVLASNVRLGDAPFLTGSQVESRFTLTAVTMDLQFSSRSKYVTGGACLSFQVISARLRMDSAAVAGSEGIDAICWGGGLFFDVKPVSFLFAGISLKGFTNFGPELETGEGDFRFYGGAEWGPIRVEGGFRAIVYDNDLPDQSLSYTLYGGYVQASVILKF